MWRSMEDVIRELKEEGILENDGKLEKSENGLPPGFRFHPTDEELITFYLASKVFSTNTATTCANFHNSANIFLSNSGDQIVEVDLTRCEPWDLPERARMGEKEWYMYSLRDRKYPSGLRTNRATETGYWKATGKDKQVYASGVATSGGGAGGVLIGMKKTLVFYQGRAPRGAKSKWVMHEYRLDGHFSSFRLSSKEEWVICRIFQKNNTGLEKKATTQIMHPPPLSPSPCSPFLSSLPPLHELTTTTTNNTDSTTRALADISSQPPQFANRNPNSILHSLLLNPLPNFSSISGSDTIFPSLTTTTTTTTATTLADITSSSATIFPTLSTTTVASATAAATKQSQQQQQQQHWLDRICPQIQIQYSQHQSQSQDQPLLCFDQMMMDYSHYPFPNNHYTTTDATPDNNHDNIDNDDDDNDVDTGVVHHVDGSPSFAVTALDRMLNHTINHHLPESWSFHP